MSVNKLLITSGAVFGGILLLLTLLLLFSLIDTTLYFSIFLGGIIVAVNFIAGFFTIRWGIDKSNEIFLASIFGGMLLRLIVMTAMVLISLKFLKLYTFSYILAILFFYIFFLVIEIIYLNLRKK